MKENKAKSEKKEKQKDKKIDIISITKTAAIIALVFLLGMTPLGYIPVGTLQITTVHVLVIIIAIVFGVKEGLVAGLTFGITSIITAATTTPGFFTPIFFNPLVSILPRLVLPVVAYYIFRFSYRLLSWRMKNRSALAVAAIIAAIISTVVHSVGVITLVWAFHWMSVGLTDEVLLPMMIGWLIVNMPLEILFAVIGAGIVVPILYPWFNRAEYASHEDNTAA